jgi:hypothetical protein
MISNGLGKKVYVGKKGCRPMLNIGIRIRRFERNFSITTIRKRKRIASDFIEIGHRIIIKREFRKKTKKIRLIGMGKKTGEDRVSRARFVNERDF